ncbi:MAG: transglutaminase family protein, partial [Rhodospirillaceae bacterium]
VLQHGFLVEPAPTVSRGSIDFFGNHTTYLTVEEPHNRLTIRSSFRAEIDSVTAPAPAETMPWEAVPTAAAQQSDPEALDAMQFTYPSPFSRSLHAGAYAEPSFTPGRPVLEATIDLMHRIHADFTYEGGVTDISTPIDQVLTERRGVCQDFAHLQIACLRALGLPARYVSGYLRTHPPEGEEKKVGAEASHAWLAVWAPGYGWVDLDPTNDMLPGDEHLTVAWGRDYGDVSPINGIVLGGGEQKIDVAVDVRPLNVPSPSEN